MVGLRVGDGLRVGRAHEPPRLLPPPRRVSALEARRLAPALRPGGLRGALLSWDGQLEDDARLVVAVARTAAAHGARDPHLRRGHRAARGRRRGGRRADRRRLHGAGAAHGRGRRRVDGRVDRRRGAAPQPRLAPARAAPRGWAIRARAVNVPVPGEHGRWVFALPRSDGLVAIGLTDVPGEPADEPQPGRGRGGRAARPRLRRARRAARPGRRLRPLRRAAAAAPRGDGETADLSRRHLIAEDPSGALAIVGGKLTTYRRMAQDVVDRITDRPCRTARLPLVGAAPPAALRSVAAPERLVRRYGTEAPAVAALADGRPELLELVAPGVPVCGAELLWAARHEFALTVSDLVDRRVRAGLVPAWRSRRRRARGRRALASSNAERRERDEASAHVARRNSTRVSTLPRYARQSRHGPGRPPGRYTSLPYPAAVRRSLASAHGLPRAADHRPAARLPVDQRRRRPRRTASSPTPASTSSASTAGCSSPGPPPRAHLDDRRQARPSACASASAPPARRSGCPPPSCSTSACRSRTSGARRRRRSSGERARARRGGACGRAARPTRSSAPPPPARRAPRSGSATASSGAGSSTPSATARRRSSAILRFQRFLMLARRTRPRAARARGRLRRPGAPHARVHAARRAAARRAAGRGRRARRREVRFVQDGRARAGHDGGMTVDLNAATDLPPRQRPRARAPPLRPLLRRRRRTEPVLDALRAYRNDDGGFGHAIEPDMRAPDQPARRHPDRRWRSCTRSASATTR